MRIQFGKEKDIAVFRLESLTPTVPLPGFTYPIEEYNEYLPFGSITGKPPVVAASVFMKSSIFHLSYDS
jgi:hypothetical protein